MQIANVSYCFSGLLIHCHHLYCLYVSLPYLAATLAGFFLDFPTPVVKECIFCIVGGDFCNGHSAVLHVSIIAVYLILVILEDIHGKRQAAVVHDRLN